VTESELQRDIVKALNALAHCWAVKIHGGPHQRAGLPDIVGVRRGRFFGLEVKLPGKEKSLTTLQAATLKKVHEAGGISVMVTSVEQALKAVGYGNPR
jgi:hypothetical protein